jgi:Flp pilus assembly protein TadG
MILLVGLAVDVGGQVHAKQRAQDIAVEAARAGGQQLQAPAAVRGQGAVADPGQAIAAVRSYLAGTSDVTGTASVSGGNTITVNTTSTYEPKFLSIIGIGSLTVSGHAQVQITRAVGGVPR